MAVLLVERVERPSSLLGPEAPAARTGGDRDRQRSGGLDGGLTLDEAIVVAWEGLAAQVAVACPLCGGTLRPGSAGKLATGRCGDCGTTLS